jgi:hypothetical protein
MGSCHIRLSAVTGSLEWDMKKEKWGIQKRLVELVLLVRFV